MPTHQPALYQTGCTAQYQARGKRLPGWDSHPLDSTTLPGRNLDLTPRRSFSHLRKGTLKLACGEGNRKDQTPSTSSLQKIKGEVQSQALPPGSLTPGFTPPLLFLTWRSQFQISCGFASSRSKSTTRCDALRVYCISASNSRSSTITDELRTLRFAITALS